jgi:hypothetical protein
MVPGMTVIAEFLLLLWFLIPFFVAAYALPGGLLGGLPGPARASTRLLAALVMSVGGILLAAQALLLLHAFTRTGMAAAAALPALACAAMGRRRAWWRDLGKDLAGGIRLMREWAAPPSGLLFIPGFLLILFTLVRGLFTPPLSWDSLNYHMVMAGKFVQSASAVDINFPGALTILDHYPKTFESLLGVLLLPSHTDLAANLANLPFLAVALLSLYILGTALQLPPGRLKAGVVLLGFLPAYFVYVPTQYVDPAVASLSLAGTAFSALFFIEKKFPWAAFAAASFSITLAMKTSGLAPYLAGAFCLVLFAAVHRLLSFRRLLLLAGILALALPHYIQKAAAYGNPVYPYPLTLLGHSIGEAEPSITDYIHQVNGVEREWYASHPGNRISARAGSYIYSLATLFSQAHISLGTAAMVLSLFGLFALARFPNRWLMALMLLNAFLAWAQFFTPAMEGVRLLFSLSYARLMVFPAMMTALPGLRALPRHRIVDVLFWILALTNVAWCVPEKWLMQDVYWLGISVLLGALILAALRPRRGLLAAPTLLIFLAGLPWIQQTRDRWRHSYLSQSFDVSPNSTRAMPVYPLLDLPGRPLRIAAALGEKKFTADWCFLYPLLGRRLQNDVFHIPITADGRRVDYELMKESGAAPDRAAWEIRLREARPDYFIVSSPWPPERDWIRSAPDRFTLFFESEGVEVYSAGR